MEAQATVPPDDPFAASRDMFSELPDPGTAGMTAFQLEELVDERGRELQRQLLQDHLNLRAAREEQQARERRAHVTGTDGITRTRLETGHGRLLATLFGTVRVPRCAWRSPGTGNFCPADAALSLPAGRHSHSLARLAVIEDAVVQATADIPVFYAARVPEPCTPRRWWFCPRIPRGS